MAIARADEIDGVLLARERAANSIIVDDHLTAAAHTKHKIHFW